MSRWQLSRVAVVLWAVAVAGAATVLIGPVTQSVLLVETVGLVVCLTATAALAVWFVRR